MQKSLKTLGWWMVATVAAVPLTKLAESSLDVSIFSPYIMGLWHWIQGLWSALGDDVSVSRWVILLLSLMSIMLVCFAGIAVYVNVFQKEEEEAPKGAPLTEDQQKAFVVVGKTIQAGHKIGFDDVRQFTGLSRIATQNALDHLYNVGLIKPVRSRYGSNYADLTPLGRDQYLELEKQYGWEAMN